MTPGGDFDLMVAGSGFGGSLVALIGRKLGLKTLLVERGQHPRFAIGESTSPLANLVLEQICREYDIPELTPLTAYGRWQRHYPDIRCGLKRGFTFYHHEAGTPFRSDPDRKNELLVAASPCDSVADTHWLRADTDLLFLNTAIAAGVEYVDNTAIRSVSLLGDRVQLSVEQQERRWTVDGAFLVDASGPRGLLFRELGLTEQPWPHLQGTRALYSHFAGVPAVDGPGRSGWGIPEANQESGDPPPYPPGRAAVHHVFEGGWIWSLGFDNGVTSLGAAARPWLADDLELESGEAGWANLLGRFPSLQPLAAATPLRKFDFIPSMPYRSSAPPPGPWTQLPGAAAFIDPFLSTGIPLTLLGIERLGALLREATRGGHIDRGVIEHKLRGYDRQTRIEADATSEYIAGCYQAFGHFELLASYLMYYFAASSYGEVARRLGRRDLGGLFLRADDLAFQNAIMESRRALAEWDSIPAARGHSPKPSDRQAARFRDHVRRSIASINVAGLEDPARRNWYPVDLRDLVRSADRYGMSGDEMASFVKTLIPGETAA